jgi:hypothetical protein
MSTHPEGKRARPTWIRLLVTSNLDSIACYVQPGFDCLSSDPAGRHNFEKEKLRRSLLYFGIGRWAGAYPRPLFGST